MIAAEGPSALDVVSLVLALYGAGLASFLGMSKRRRRIIVSGYWGTERLGEIRNHLFFIVRIVNTGERAVTISEIEWHSDDLTFSLYVFRHSKGKELPVKVEPDEEVRVLFDCGFAAEALAPSGNAVTSIRVIESAGQAWTISVDDLMREEAEDSWREDLEHDAVDDE